MTARIIKLDEKRSLNFWKNSMLLIGRKHYFSKICSYFKKNLYKIYNKMYEIAELIEIDVLCITEIK